MVVMRNRYGDDADPAWQFFFAKSFLSFDLKDQGDLSGGAVAVIVAVVVFFYTIHAEKFLHTPNTITLGYGLLFLFFLSPVRGESAICINGMGMGSP